MSFTSKAEKVLSAVYLVTEHIKDEEIIKDKVRSLASQILTDFFQATHQNDQALKRHFWRVISSRLSELAAFLRVAETAGLVSLMNADIILREIDGLYGRVGSYLKIKPNEGSLPALGTPEASSVQELFTPGVEAKEPVKAADSVGVSTPVSQPLPKKDTSFAVKDTMVKTLDKGKEMKTRQEKIKDILKEHGKLSIKHIARHIPGCSEKTVQRDLNKMIDVAQVVREGEKRWSVYRLP